MTTPIGRFSAKVGPAVRNLSRAASGPDLKTKRAELSSSDSSVPRGRSLSTSKPTTMGQEAEKFKPNTAPPKRLEGHSAGYLDSIYQAPAGVDAESGTPSLGKLSIGTAGGKAGFQTPQATGENIGKGRHVSGELSGSAIAVLIDPNKPAATLGAFAVGAAVEVTDRGEGRGYKGAITVGGSVSDLLNTGKFKTTLTNTDTRTGEGSSLEVDIGGLEADELTVPRVAKTKVGPNDASKQEYKQARAEYQRAGPDNSGELHELATQASDGPGRDGPDYSQAQEHMQETISEGALGAATAGRNAIEAESTGYKFKTDIVTPKELRDGVHDDRFKID